MNDQSGRKIEYLRLSVTDLCNYRCQYCMREDQPLGEPTHPALSIGQLAEIGRAAVACGVRKIRLTGGEPLVRPGLLDLCRTLKALPGLEELALTTNGSLLPQFAKDLKAAGLDHINISIDSLKNAKFSEMTRQGRLDEALSGIAAAEDAGFTKIKINTVLIGGFNTDEIADFVALTRDNDLSVRFIELMPIGECADWPKERFVSADRVLKARPDLTPVDTDGVAELYALPGYKGTVGLIRPMSHNFCGTCNRIRVTTDGRLKPCLHSSAEIDLSGLHGAALLHAIRQGIFYKPKSHRLNADGKSRATRNMNQIGG